MTSTNRTLAPETLAAQALGYVDPATGALVPPIHSATTYERPPGDMHGPGYSYTRSGNPTYHQVEALLARLEGAEVALVMASGMSAATAPFLALDPGDHVVVQDVIYWGVRAWLNDFATRWGVEVEYASAGNLDELRATVRPGKTKLVWIETPANPLWDVVDIAGAAEIAHAAGARLAVDSTVATPVLTRPLEHGADIVMHSATKFLNGHSDVLAGVLATNTRDAYWARIEGIRKNLGTVIGPQEAWLLLRGMRTLHLRVRQASANALALAEVAARHPKVIHVLYPGLPTHPGHATAVKQMTGGFSGMLSIRVAGGKEGALQVMRAMDVFVSATSLGGTESLVEHRRSTEGPDSPVPEDLIRIAVGIEHVDDLVGDLTQALDTL
ncbi:MAG: aminotransferase class I/II-fold pyridoxal phosphate-dependent enzyme [Alphaproteobacteria bacterium]|nr:aminotransferase class I/II-fold pyridoxal phosphate-dependent enzyme [Alphaproteobacteria bacterium]